MFWGVSEFFAFCPSTFLFCSFFLFLVASGAFVSVCLCVLDCLRSRVAVLSVLFFIFFFLVASHFFCSKPGYIPYPRPGYMPYPHAFDASSCRFLWCRGMAVSFFFFLTCLSPSFLLYYFLYIIALSFRIGWVREVLVGRARHGTCARSALRRRDPLCNSLSSQLSLLAPQFPLL